VYSCEVCVLPAPCTLLAQGAVDKFAYYHGCGEHNPVALPPCLVACLLLVSPAHPHCRLLQTWLCAYYHHSSCGCVDNLLTDPACLPAILSNLHCRVLLTWLCAYYQGISGSQSIIHGDLLEAELTASGLVAPFVQVRGCACCLVVCTDRFISSYHDCDSHSWGRSLRPVPAA
jgi:hypothetical protein